MNHTLHIVILGAWTVVSTVAISVFLDLLAIDVRAWLRRLPNRALHLIVKLLPRDNQAQKEADFSRALEVQLNDTDDRPIGRLVKAAKFLLSLLFGIPGMRWGLNSRPSQTYYLWFLRIFAAILTICGLAVDTYATFARYGVNDSPFALAAVAGPACICLGLFLRLATRSSAAAVMTWWAGAGTIYALWVTCPTTNMISRAVVSTICGVAVVSAMAREFVSPDLRSKVSLLLLGVPALSLCVLVYQAATRDAGPSAFDAMLIMLAAAPIVVVLARLRRAPTFRVRQ